MQFLFIGSQFMLHASFPHSVTLLQLRFTLLAVTSSQRDLHPQVCAHAKKKPPSGGLKGSRGEPSLENRKRPQGPGGAGQSTQRAWLWQQWGYF